MTAAPGSPTLTGACEWQYPDHPDAVAEHIADSDPTASYTVKCIDGNTYLGGLNLTGYCASLVSGMVSDNPDRGGPASDQPPPWDQWECVPS
jgi:hypothetical protein